MAIAITDPNMVEYNKYKDKIMSLAYQEGMKVLTFTEELRRLCKVHGYSFPGMWIQAVHETDDFTSDAWKKNTNPAGIKNASGNKYQTFYNGVDAARALVVHMSAYTPAPKYASRLKNYLYVDNRYTLALQANQKNRRVFTTFHDLAGYWAEDRLYGEKIEAQYRYLLGG